MTNEIKKIIAYTELFELTRNSKAKVLVHVGGAGSSKSHSIAQYIIYLLVTKENKTIGVCRKTFPALRMTAMALIINLLKEYGIYDEAKHNKTANIYVHGSNTIHFFSIDDVEKVKSANFSVLWLEEGNEFEYNDYIVLKLRLRAPVKDGERNQMLISLNPSDAFGWIPIKLCGVQPSV